VPYRSDLFRRIVVEEGVISVVTPRVGASGERQVLTFPISEVDEAKLVDPGALRRDVRLRPDRYTPWFRISLERVLSAEGL
jgi:isopentenyldiphosphate isomerase